MGSASIGSSTTLKAHGLYRGYIGIMEKNMENTIYSV